VRLLYDFRNRGIVPLLRIVTFTDVIDDVRRTPFDDVQAITIGSGFVNSVLNADQIEREEELLPLIQEIIYEFFHVRPEWFYQFGVFYDDGVFMAKDFFQVFGNIIEPTDREYLIFKYLQMTSWVCDYVPAERICRFCYPAAKLPKNEREAAKNLAVHVTNLNQKSQKVMDCHLIEAKRFIGYRIRKDI